MNGPDIALADALLLMAGFLFILGMTEEQYAAWAVPLSIAMGLGSFLMVSL